MTWWSVLSYANARSVRDGFPPCYELVDCNDESPASRLECAAVNVLTPSGSVLDCEGYRLPTEAEWEYAYRAGTSTGYYSGEVQGGGCDPYRPLDEIAWYCATTDSRPHPVAQKVPNAWGLYDMAGNAFEWTWSLYGRIPDGPLVDWEGPASGGDRTMRGGSFNEMAGRQRAATRLSENPAGGRRWLGFRLVRSLP
jgi:formylglycine-generating enzyme required for sulfatase activity